MQSLESEFSSGKDLFEKDNKPRSVLAIKNRLQADFDSKLINVANLFLRYKTSIQPFATEILIIRLMTLIRVKSTGSTCSDHKIISSEQNHYHGITRWAYCRHTMRLLEGEFVPMVRARHCDNFIRVKQSTSTWLCNE
jgi:hypothetical protein